MSAISHTKVRITELETMIETLDHDDVRHLIYGACIDELKEVLALMEQETPEAHLKRAQAEAIERARAYREQYGNPVNNLVKFFDEWLDTDEKRQTWAKLIEEGC